MKENKAGYKHTPLGWIPEDWQIKSLQSIVVFSNGKAHENSISEDGKYILINSKFVSSEGKEFKRSNLCLSPLRKLDIVMVMSDVPNGKAIAKCFMIDEDNKYTLNQRICSLKIINDDELFVFYSINRNKYYLQYDDGVSQTNLKKEEVLGCEISIPPLPEQKAIAKVLSTWDKAIEKTQELIKQKELRKKYLMQQLLTGKKRLMGFSGEWKTLRMGDVFERVTRKNNGLSTNVVTISAQRGFVKQDDFFKKIVASDTLDNYFLIKKGEFCYNKSYCNGYDWGATKRLKDFDEAVVTTLYICFKFQDGTKYSGDYFEYFFDANLLDNGLTQIAHEGGRAHGLLNVTPNDFFNLELRIPEFAEQTKIAKYIESSALEIKLMNNYLSALINQKKGLMQMLLTGKKRIKIKEGK